jgi:glutathione S-transferase
MKLFYAPSSPFVRKVMACAIELGLEGKIETTRAAAHPVNRDRNILAASPLGQVPTLVTDDGLALYDSRVICEYLDQLGGGGKLFPRDSTRWQALVEQSAADGLLDAALLCRYEATVRPEELRYAPWRDGQMDKIATALAQFEKWLPGFANRVDIGTITVGCALGYLDFRFADYGWRKGRDGLAAWFAGFDTRPAMEKTRPHD